MSEFCEICGPPLTPEQAQDLVLCSEGNRATLDAYADGLRRAASLISQSLPKGQSDGSGT